jgi:putative ABC transport system permease protein
VANQDPLPLRICLLLLRLFSAVVPRAGRVEWRQEWESEFRHRREDLASSGRIAWSDDMDLIRRALGALPDAAWLRRQFTMDAELVHDLQHGIRLMWKSPLFSIPAISVLAIGIGGTLAIATLLDTLLFRPLPYDDADRVVTVWQRPAVGGRDDVAPANFLDWRERSRSFAALSAVIPYSYDFTGGGEPEVFFGAQVTENFFEALGARALMGRTFTAEDHVPGAKPVVIITHGLWQRRFGADPSIVNNRISLDGQPFTVVGVLPPGFRPQLLPRPGELSVWTPKVILEHERRVRGSAWWNVVGRLKPGVAVPDAQNELDAIAAALAREYPRTNQQVGATIVPFREHLMGDVRLPLFVMFGAALLVLAIGCANVANLLLARGIERGREFAIRVALGAGRARLLRQLVVESLLIASLATIAGTGLAYWAIGGIVALAPANILRLQDAAIDRRALAFAVGLTLSTALAFGMLPAFQFSRTAAHALRERNAAPPGRGFRRLLVSLEVALAVVLLTGAGLLIRSFERLIAVDPGFSPKHVVALQVFAYDRNPTADRVRAFFRATLDRLRTLPGVEAAGAVSAMPFANANIDIKSDLEVVGRPAASAEERRGIYVTIATPGYFRALTIPLREGRYLDDRDGAGRPIVAVISDVLRRREWPQESPIGRRVRVQWQGQPIEAEVVGVVGQIRHERLDAAARPELFLSLDQVPFASMTYVVKATGDPAAMIDAARHAVWSVDPLQTFYETGQVDRMVAASVTRQRFSMMLLTTLSAVALVLCAIGIYGVISFTTAQRTREIGVRVALGADRAAILRMILREGSAVVATGVALGLLGSLAATRYLRQLLFEVRAIDPLTMTAVCGMLAAVALAACYIPARRATRIDPVVALRTE